MREHPTGGPPDIDAEFLALAAATRVTARGPDGSFSVESTLDGKITSVRIDPDRYRSADVDDLATALVETLDLLRTEVLAEQQSLQSTLLAERGATR